MQKNLYQVKKSTYMMLLFLNIIGSKYENWLPSNLFLQRLNLVLQGYIILDRTDSFHRISVNSPKNLQKLSVCRKS